MIREMVLNINSEKQMIILQERLWVFFCFVFFFPPKFCISMAFWCDQLTVIATLVLGQKAVISINQANKWVN